MASGGTGRDLDRTFNIDPNMATSTTEYLCVGMLATTTLNDYAVALTCNTGTAGTGGTPTGTSNHCLGVNQTLLSASSSECTVRLFGTSKVKAAESISAGDFIRPYQGISTTTFAGHVSAIADRGTVSAATQSIASHTVILGRALEDASTNTVIEALIMPHLYDNNLVASTT